MLDLRLVFLGFQRIKLRKTLELPLYKCILQFCLATPLMTKLIYSIRPHHIETIFFYEHHET